MTDEKDRKDDPKPWVPPTGKVSQPRPLSLVAEEPAMIGTLPTAAKITPPAMSSPAEPLDEAGRAEAESRAEDAEVAADAAKLDAEAEAGLNDLGAAVNELRETMRALDELLDAMPK